MTDKTADDTGAGGIPGRAWLFLLMMALAWGATWPLMKTAVAEIPVFSFRAINVIGASSALMAVSWLTARRVLPYPGEWRRIWIIGLFNVGIWFSLSAVALQTIPAGRGALLAFTTPLWAMMLERAFYGVPVTGRRGLGILLALAAIAVLTYRDLLSETPSYIGIVAILVAAFAQTTGSVLQQRSRFQTPLFALIGWQMLLGGMPIVIAAALLDDQSWQASVSFEALSATIALTFFSICCGVIAWYSLLRVTNMGFAAVGSLVVPFSGVMLSAVTLGEVLTPQDIAGLVLITAAIAVTTRASRSGKTGRDASA